MKQLNHYKLYHLSSKYINNKRKAGNLAVESLHFICLYMVELSHPVTSMIQAYYWSAFHLHLTNQEVSFVGYFFRPLPDFIGRNFFSHVIPNVAVIVYLNKLHIFLYKQLKFFGQTFGCLS